MRVVFMGTPDFAVPCLQQLLEDGHQVVGVFTQPDRPKGRGYAVTPPPVKALALEAGLPVYQPQKLRDGSALEIFQTLKPQLAVVVAYGRILPLDLLEVPSLGCINIHGSLLPRHRGAAPIQWSVIQGDKVAGVTSMFLVEKMDAGDMILKAEIPLGDEETAGELYERLAPLGAQCLSDTMKLFERGNVPRIPQEETQATLAPMLTKETGQLDFNRPARELHNLIRGLNPWPSAWVCREGKLLKIHRSALHPELTAGNALPGTLLNDRCLLVACGGGSVLELIQVQSEGKSRISGEEFLRGARLGRGTALAQAL